MIIGFDFDKVFIDYPPFIPYSLIDFLYKGTQVFIKTKNKKEIRYRFPGLVEQKLRILSHFPIFRHPIKPNITSLRRIRKETTHTTYLVSSRFGFLRKRTDVVFSKNKLKNCFDGVYFNFQNKQPHLFKEQTIKKLNIDTYIDDDLDLALYLSKKLPNLKIFWVQDGRANKINLPINITPIRTLSELYKIIKR